EQAEVYEFSATSRTSGVKIPSGSSFALPKEGSERVPGGMKTRFRRKAAHDALAEFVDYDVKSGEPPSDTIEILKGAPDSIRKIALSIPANFDSAIDKISVAGETPMAIARNRE